MTFATRLQLGGVFDKTYNNIIRYLGKSSQYRLLKLFDWGHPLAYVDENG